MPLRFLLGISLAVSLSSCLIFTKAITPYPNDWGSLRPTSDCSELTGRYSNAGVDAIKPPEAREPVILWAEQLGPTLARWAKHPMPDSGSKGIQYVELNVPKGGQGVDVAIYYQDHVDRFVMPWGAQFQCVQGVARMVAKYNDAGDLPGRSTNKIVRDFARTSRGGLVVSEQTSTLEAGAVLFVVEAGGSKQSSWHGWPAYGDTPFRVTDGRSW
ncbi:hypothetical protein [Dyella mobilis]|uniref:Lipoprotein n=1 Tax=Dyella mobilis TaxID=1849582 RepID=A0ABS2KJ33_9GAMM|nr:hypothetical protein [Dyella mobilis]MBM7131192.1 hypothetical protein [Dyella mobilis]